MATYTNFPDGEGRPPESPTNPSTNRKYKNRKHIPKRNESWSYPQTNNNLIYPNNNNNDEILSTTINNENCLKNYSSLKQSIPKFLCLKRPTTVPLSSSEFNSLNNSNNNNNNNKLKFLNVNDLKLSASSKTSQFVNNKSINNENPSCSSSSSSAAAATTTVVGEGKKFVGNNRNSFFHQDCEEALNSLLWQPYEYQNNQNQQQKKPSSASTSCCSSSSSSSCSSLTSFDLDDCSNKGPYSSSSLHSLQEEEEETADLNLCTEMVNNLKLFNQSLNGNQSRDDYVTTTSRLNKQQQNIEVSVVECSTNGCGTASVECYYNSRFSDCDVYKKSDMQLEIPTNIRNDNNNVLLNIVTTNQDGLMRHNNNNNNVTVFQNVRNGTTTTLGGGGGGGGGTITTTTIDNNFNKPTNLSSANVVGLPNHHHHSRRASVPSSTSANTAVATTAIRTGNGGTIYPNHPRNISEPSTNFRYSNNNQTNIVPIRNNNDSLISHLRSASVPKSMPITNHHHHQRMSSDLNSRFNQKLVPPPPQQQQQQQQQQPSLNVSNVNVNFYRAVPVNVVSSVPTIQCLNTVNGDDNGGNNVSNVHIMPLGSTGSNSLQYQSVNNNNNPSTLINQTTSSTTTSFPYSTASSITGTTQVTVHNSHTPHAHSIQIPTNIQVNNNQRSTNEVVQQRSRTFTSTEAQTDEISVCPPPVPPPNTTVNNNNMTREQRRKERRERRHQRRINNHRHIDTGTQANDNNNNNSLPDILNSHLPPPYTPLPNHNHNTSNNNCNLIPSLVPNVVVPNPVMVPQQIVSSHPPILQTVVPNNIVPSGLVPFQPPPQPPQIVAGQVPLVQGGGPVPVPVPPPSGFRFPFPAGGFRRGRFSEEPPKGCCGLLAWKPGSLRWFIAVIALVAICCVLVGTALGAMRPAGRDHLTVSLLMIGVGIVLVSVSAVAWRLTSHDSSTCRSMLGLGSTESVDVCARRFVPRLPPSYGRPHHPYAAMMYPEFQYRPPPPSYQASMQEYRLRLLLLDRGNTPQIQAGIQNAVSPPPTYRSHAGSLLRAPLSSRRDTTQSEYSCPPSYRSQTSTNRPVGNNNNNLQNNNSSVLHSREQSLSLSESNNGESVVNIVSILGSTEEDIALDNITLDSLKMEPENDVINPLKMLLKASSNNDLVDTNNKDGNLVTIVQTSDQNPVIVTVSGNSHIHEGSSVQITEIPSEMDILAHL